MKKFLLMILALAVFAACEKTDPVADMDGDLVLKSVDATGNGAPSGPHYTLNLIGIDSLKAKQVPLDDKNGHRIFIDLVGSSKIELIEGPEFQVLDANASDDDPAQFQLPDPNLDPYFIGDQPDTVDYMSAYSVFVRPLGKPGGMATITTCADLVDSYFSDFLSKKYQNILTKAINNDPGGFGGYASLENVALILPVGSKGKPKFENVTAELLTIVISVTITTDTGTYTELIRIPIFDDMLEGEYWQVDNDGLRLIQIRFYPGVQTDVRYADVKF